QGDGARERPDRLGQLPPVSARAGVAVHEHHGLARVPGPGFEHGRADRSHGDARAPERLALAHAVSQRLGFSTKIVLKTCASSTPCSRSVGTTSSNTSVIDQLRIAPWLSNTGRASSGYQSMLAPKSWEA